MRFLLLLLFIPYLVFSQTNTDIQSKKFDSIFYRIAVNISSSDPVKALYLADSLFLYSESNHNKIKSLMLTADILAKQEKRGEAIVKSLEVINIAEDEKDYVLLARNYGFLATQYRMIGFYDKGKSFLEKGIKISDYFSNKKQIENYKAICNVEFAEFALEEKDYQKAIEHLEFAFHIYNKDKNLQNNSFSLAKVEEMFGRCYLFLDDYEKALSHFSNSRLLINDVGAENTIWASLIYKRLGDVYLNLNKKDSSYFYLNKALSISEKSNHGSLKENVYKSISEFYKLDKELDSFALYNSKYIAQLDINKEKKKIMINSAYKALNINSNKSDVVPNSKNYIVLFLALAIALLIFMYLKTKKIFSNTNNKTLIIDNSKTTDIVLPKKTEEDLVEKLKEFEASNGFLDKNMSLPTLIGLLNTNTKYFRNFLKNYKNTDYTHYINNLRINYIKNKLTTDKAYLNYKISYLADECGFSSHSKFSACFKDITGYSPSEFIEDIKNSN
ncbi:helix-turn-helix domain-containing protein [Lutibacter sp. A80]|uniref:AraC family transcriptional regulator n=1 Tax=Lutibacter sp. A80 TaxID=2918453 RepID=UPI001F06B3F8|nr:AraC family transcriptional regulator [Lutibacter sp. A80]UMB59996.1 helix-turn-helix domain-containing protein [Lutibacter sp. A80]